MNIHGSTNFVRPVQITSPISGAPSRPKLIKSERNGKIYTEAHWYCPTSGQFIRKGLVSIEDKTSS